jgi:hypothetical protein
VIGRCSFFDEPSASPFFSPLSFLSANALAAGIAAAIVALVAMKFLRLTPSLSFVFVSFLIALGAYLNDRASLGQVETQLKQSTHLDVSTVLLLKSIASALQAFEQAPQLTHLSPSNDIRKREYLDTILSNAPTGHNVLQKSLPLSAVITTNSSKATTAAVRLDALTVVSVMW